MSNFTRHDDALYGRTIYHDAARRVAVVQTLRSGECTAYVQQDSMLFGCSTITHLPVVGLVGVIGTDALPAEIEAMPGWRAGTNDGDARAVAVHAFWDERKAFGRKLIAEATGC